MLVLNKYVDHVTTIQSQREEVHEFVNLLWDIIVLRGMTRFGGYGPQMVNIQQRMHTKLVSLSAFSLKLTTNLLSPLKNESICLVTFKQDSAHVESQKPS
jgi:hypothetical protein